MRRRCFSLPQLFPWIFFTILGIIWTWPLVLHMRTFVAGNFDDNLQFVWQAAWVKQLLSGDSGSLFFTPLLNYPHGWSLANSEYSISQIILGLPGTFFGGPVFGYNLAVLLSNILCGVFMYLWIRELSGKSSSISLPGTIAGTIYACLPFWYAHFYIGHLDLVAIQWFPLYFWGLFDLLQGKPGNKAVIFTGVFLGVIALTSQYYLYMTIVVTIIAGFIYILIANRLFFLSPKLWMRLLAAAVIALPFIGLVIYPYLSLAGQGGLQARDINSLRIYMARLEDFLVPSNFHFLWGSWISERFNRSQWIEGSLYLGVPSSILFLIGVMYSKHNPGLKKIVTFLLMLLVIAFILALGIDFRIFNQPAPYPPLARIQDWLDSRTPIYLPGSLFVKYVPFYATMRAVKRFGALGLMALAAGAGLGFSILLKRIRPNRTVFLTCIIIAMIFIDFGHKPIQRFSEAKPRQVDLWLAEQPRVAGVTQMPFHLVAETEFIYYSIYNQKPFIGGFFSAFPPANYLEIKPVLDRFPDEPSVALLKDLSIGYIVINAGDYRDFPFIHSELIRLGLSLAYNAEGNYVYTVPPRPG